MMTRAAVIARAALAALGAFTAVPAIGCAGVDPATPPAGPVTTLAPVAGPGATPMLDTVRDLARLLATSSVTVDDFVRRFGPITADHGPSAALDLGGADARFRRVQLWRDADTGVPTMLALELAPAAQPAVTELARVFGAYKRSRPAPEDAPPDLIFQGIAKDAATATLIARTGEPTVPLDRAPVVTIRLVREPRLD